jgi:signal transduction histidine kinase
MTSRESDDVAEQLNELGQLASGVGHHVINAFSAIVSNAELLRLMAESPNPGDSVAMAELIVRTALDASAVARRLIDFSRTATATHPAPVAVDRLIAALADEERSRVPASVGLLTELGTVPPIAGNALQLRAMLRHILTNSYEALPRLGGTITLATSQDDRGWVVVEVRDTGVGLTAQAQERAVEPFYTTKAGHFGVGLSIANGIWRRHRGTLAIRGQQGLGTTVRLCVEPADRTLPASTPGRQAQ